MKIAEYDINAAEGVHVFAEYNLDNRYYPQGSVLTAEDIIIFKMFGIRKVYGALMENNDVIKSTALGMIAAKICGENTAYYINDTGEAIIVADADGVLAVSEERVRKFNHLHANLRLNTIGEYNKVVKGEVIAKLDIASPLMSQDDVDTILFSLSGNTSLLRIAMIGLKKTALIYSKILGNEKENEHFTKNVKMLLTSMNEYGLEFGGEYNVKYQKDAVADVLQDVMKAGYEVVFMLGGTRSVCDKDVFPAALNSVCDDVVGAILPQVGNDDLFLAQQKQTKIIGLPFNYASVFTGVSNKIIRQFLFSENLLENDFTWVRAVPLSTKEVLSEETQKQLICANSTGGSDKKANIAAVVLAAGIGSRSGRNKLMVETKNGEPLFMKAVRAAVGSDACPVFVITGHHDQEMAEILSKFDVNIIYNPAYRSGVKTSLSLGLKSVPDFCDGAVIIPADMPNITSAVINKLIAKFDKKQKKQVCVLSYKGIKSNPIVWSRELYAKADIVPENANLRPVFMEHADYTNLIDIKDKSKLLDVNFPSDIEKIIKQNKNSNSDDISRK